MYLLSIKVKQAELQGPPHKFNAYVCVKVKNLKVTTVPLRSNEPSWNQDYTLEVNNLEKSLFVEVWDKGPVWDVLLGSVRIPLSCAERRTQDGPAYWWPLLSYDIIEGGEDHGLDRPTIHKILLDLSYELLAEIPEDKSLCPEQRSGALNTDGGMREVSEEEGQFSPSSLSTHEDDANGCIVHSAEPVEVPTDDQDGDYWRDADNSLPAGDTNNSAIPMESVTRVSTDFDITASMETGAPSGTNDSETRSSFSTVPCSQRDDLNGSDYASSSVSLTCDPPERSNEGADLTSLESPSPVRVHYSCTLLGKAICSSASHSHTQAHGSKAIGSSLGLRVLLEDISTPGQEKQETAD